ncbi:MAG: response regulator [Thermoproteota archaeon]|jgi:DNA-binding response OmpR family regulator|nr:response regulator [Thermoproteota archaeon]
MVLEENGFKVDSFTDPLLALDEVREETGLYDLIILDIKMPKMNGFELYREIKKRDDKVKVCFLTGSELYYGEYADIFNTLDGRYFIQKPIENEELIARLNKIIITDSTTNKTT